MSGLYGEILSVTDSAAVFEDSSRVSKISLAEKYLPGKFLRIIYKLQNPFSSGPYATILKAEVFIHEKDRWGGLLKYEKVNTIIDPVFEQNHRGHTDFSIIKGFIKLQGFSIPVTIRLGSLDKFTPDMNIERLDDIKSRVLGLFGRFGAVKRKSKKRKSKRKWIYVRIKNKKVRRRVYYTKKGRAYIRVKGRKKMI